MNPFHGSVSERANGRCEYCQAPEQAFNFAFEVEHILPVSRGGANELHNLALACHACNRFKSDFVLAHDVELDKNCPLFNPRVETWSEHFGYDPETAEIVGVTAIGRVTVARLQMNRPRHVNARRFWVELGLYPIAVDR